LTLAGAPSPPPGNRVIHFVVAFATTRHANDAVRFLAGTALVAGDPTVQGGDGPDFAVVEVDVETGNRDRLATLINGLHGILMSERSAIEAIA
jgi:hypothetical protein